MNYSDLARIAYHNYGSVTNWLNYQGLPMPEYTNLPETIKQAWEAAVRSVVLETAGNSNYHNLISTISTITTEADEVTTVVDESLRAEVTRIAHGFNYRVVEKLNTDGTFTLKLNRVVPKSLKQQVEEQIATNEAELKQEEPIVEPKEQEEEKPTRKQRKATEE